MAAVADANDQMDLEYIKTLIPFNELQGHQFQEAIKCCEQISVPERKKLFKRGEKDSHWYYLIMGSVNLLDENFEITSVWAADEQCLSALDDQIPHRVSAITTSDCIMLKVDKKRLELAMTWEQADSQDPSTSEEDNDDESDWMSSLLESDVFSKVPPANIQRLFATFKSVAQAKGDVVVAEGGQGDRFYVIEKGQAQVSKRTANGIENIVKLGPGNFFGEEALIGGTTRNATVTMLSGGSLMYLDENDFKNLLEQPVLHGIDEKDLTSLQEDFNELVIVDVRLSGEFKHFHREDSINIPLNKLRVRMNSLDKTPAYIVSNNAGPRSELGVYLMIKAGFHAYLLRESEQ